MLDCAWPSQMVVGDMRQSSRIVMGVRLNEEQDMQGLGFGC